MYTHNIFFMFIQGITVYLSSSLHWIVCLLLGRLSFYFPRHLFLCVYFAWVVMFAKFISNEFKFKIFRKILDVDGLVFLQMRVSVYQWRCSPFPEIITREHLSVLIKFIMDEVNIKNNIKFRIKINKVCDIPTGFFEKSLEQKCYTENQFVPEKITRVYWP